MFFVTLPPERPRRRARTVLAMPARLGSIAGAVLLLVLAALPARAQCPLSCYGNLTLALEADGTNVIAPSEVLTSSTTCDPPYSVVVTDALGNSYGNTVDGQHIGLDLTVTVTHLAGGNACSANLTVVDFSPPVIACTDTLVAANVPTDPASFGYPNVSDNVTPLTLADLSYTDVFTDDPCFTTYQNEEITAHIERTWTATDAQGNTGTCTQTLYLRRLRISDVVYPAHRDGHAAPALICGTDDPEDFDLTGRPTVDGFPIGDSDLTDMAVTYFTNSETACGGSENLVRTWFITDLCSDEQSFSQQFIDVTDQTAPVFDCPAPLTAYTYSNACAAPVTLPSVTATDECGSATVAASWQFGSGFEPFANIPAGQYPVTYTATDDCGNTSTCELTVTILDDDAPTPICEFQSQVTLQPDGTALVYALTFDDNSHDNCGIETYEVSRDGLTFDEFIDFSCEDLLNSPIQVTLRVTDAAGLSSQCISNVNIIDQVAPSITCPADITINCTDNKDKLSLTGQPFSSDNCGILSVDYSDAVNTNACGFGTITRTWTTLDNSNNARTCQQLIRIQDLTPLQVTFPADLTLAVCDAPLDTLHTGVPQLSGNDCEQLGISHTDFRFDEVPNVPNACFKIVRNWVVIDWCEYTPNDPSGAGIYEHTQVLLIEDYDAPTISCPENLTVNILQASCETYATLPLPTALDCSPIIDIHNDSPYADADGADASGVYPAGVHTITYTASDRCGNASSCQLQVTVVDGLAPSPICNNGVSVTLNEQGFVMLTPAVINNGTSDNCTPTEQIQLTISPNIFDCGAVGDQQVTLSATDLSGNTSFCQTIITVQNNLDACPDPGTTANISGNLMTEDGQTMAGQLIGMTGTINNAVTTSADGDFSFSGLPQGGNYTLTPVYNENAKAGISTLDIVFLRKHILGIDLLDSPYQIIAADVNNSKSLSTLDIVGMRKVILGLTGEFQNNTSWRFVPALYAFPDPLNPWANGNVFPEIIQVNNLGANEPSKDFVAIKVGDINQSFSGGLINEDAQDRNAAPWTLTTQDQQLVAGLVYRVRFDAADTEALLGLQAAFDFDTERLRFTGWARGENDLLQAHHLSDTYASRGSLRLSWTTQRADQWIADGDWLELRFTALQDGLLSEVLRLDTEALRPEVYTGQWTDTDIAVRPISLAFTPLTTDDFALLQNTPNPFTTQTTIGFSLPEAGTATLRVYDLTGRTLHEQTGDYPAGAHRIALDLAPLQLPDGVLYYELRVAEMLPQVKRMVVAR